MQKERNAWGLFLVILAAFVSGTGACGGSASNPVSATPGSGSRYGQVLCMGT